MPEGASTPTGPSQSNPGKSGPVAGASAVSSDRGAVATSSRFADIGIDFLAVVMTRAVMFVLLFLATWDDPPGSIARGLVLIYGFSTILYLATWASTYRSTHASPVGFLLFFQFLVEILVEAALFYSNAGYLSDYGLLFILTILSAGLFFQFWGSFVMATLATVVHAYAGGMHLGLNGPLEIELPRLLLETVQTRFFLFATLFYLVALLSSLLARKLAAARKELEGTHLALDRYQYSAESMMNDLPTGLLFFDPAGGLKYRNRLCEEWFERSLEPGMPREAVLGGLVGDDILRAISRMGETFPVREMEIESPSGRPLHVQIKILTHGQEHLGMVFILMDFTQERMMARELLRAERMAALGAMSARIAHEIRNPLASISGSAQMLQETGLDGDQDRRLLSLIVTESGRLDRVLSGLLDYAKDRTPTYREVSMASIFRKIRLVLEKNPNFNNDLAIVSEFIENGDVRFSSDQDILEQVLLNVALNALQALPEGKGSLVLRAASKGKNVVIEVQDNGCGMTRQEAARAFEPFFTTKAQGTGLGLATCLHYVHAMQGSIQLVSEKATGTTVSITLPYRQA